MSDSNSTITDSTAAVYFLLPDCIISERRDYYTNCPLCITVLEWYVEKTEQDPDKIKEGRILALRNVEKHAMKMNDEKVCCNGKDEEFSTKTSR
jgi:hypothetical protein